MVKILDRDDPVLRQKAKVVLPKDIKSPKIKKIIRDMKTALDSQEDGVAIAAPQIGFALRIFVVSPKVFDIIGKEEAKKGTKKITSQYIICINPKIIKTSREKMVVEEGCLSVRYLYGNVTRAEKVRIRATNIAGKEFELGGSGLFAQIFQHEIDHLDGVLFTDKATDIHEMPPASADAPAGKPEKTNIHD